MKKIISAAIAFCILIPTLLFSTQAASDNDREAFAVNEDLYTLLETNPGAFEKEQLKNFRLRDTDIPLCMEETDIKSGDAIARMKILEKDMSSLTYLNSDGTLTSYLFGENVKYRSGEEVLDKTNVLDYDVEKKAYFNPDNDVRIELPLFLSAGSPVSIAYEDHTVSFAPAVTRENSSKKCFKSEKENYIIYDNVFGEGIDVKYTPMFSGVKEDIILSSSGAVMKVVP